MDERDYRARSELVWNRSVTVILCMERAGVLWKVSARRGGEKKPAQIHIQDVHSKDQSTESLSSRESTVIAYKLRLKKAEIRSTHQTQEELTRPAAMLAPARRYWALVFVTAPCFCRRWSRSWLLCLKWRSHFSHCGKETKFSHLYGPLCFK